MKDESVRTRLIEHPRGSRRKHARVHWTDASGAHAVVIDQRMLIGSASAAQLMVSDDTVSRLHAELEPREGGVWIRDLGSRNGTWVDGIEVERARVAPGAKVRVGQTDLHFDRESVNELVQLWPHERFEGLLGTSGAMRELFAQLARIAPMASSVLIHGETGTGKELVARAIHDASPRAKHPFVVIDCAALPEQLLESELFGHAKGAFTGAVSARAGAIEAGEQGTVFLDEIGELPLAMQPKLLRVLESRTVRRVGETSPRAVDVRFVSATHRDLRTMVNAGAFREDLYFRLAVIPVEVPPLRDRAEDVPPLIGHFLPPDRREMFSSDDVAELAKRPWLGNVRELRNFVERAVALGIREALAIGDAPTSSRVAPGNTSAELPSELSFDRPYKEMREAWLDYMEREYLQFLSTKYERNVSAMAQAAGVDRTYVYRLIRKHNVR